MSSTSQASTGAGQLASLSVPQLLAEAWRDRRSGCLRITRADRETLIHITDGAPTGAESNSTEDGFAAGLAEAGSISTAERLKVEKLAADRECSEASAVHALGLLDAKVLYQALRDVTRARICDVLDWAQGEYAWAPPSPDHKATGKPFDILKMMQEQLPERWGVDRLFEALLPHSDCVVELTPSVRRITDQLSNAGPMARQVLEGLDGSTSIGRLLGVAAGDPLAASTLWVLVTAGLVRARSVDAGEEAPAYDFEVVVEGENPNARRDSTTTKEAEADANIAATTNPRSDELRGEIASMLAKLGDLTHYSALGVEEDANTVQIKKAYFKAAKKYHPDALARLGLDEFRDGAAQVFARISEAFETLSNDAKRAAYDSGADEVTNIDTARLAQAETSFRKGEILVKMGNFAAALEYLEPAVELWPDEPAYQAELGWALFKQPESDPTRAREHLEIACNQQSVDALSLFRMSLVLTSLGDTKASEDYVVRARMIDPHISD